MKGFNKTQGERFLVSDLYDYAPEWLQDYLSAIDDTLLDMSEKELSKELISRDLKLAVKLREKFWIEYKNAKADNRRMVGLRVITGVCSQAKFRKVLDNQYSFGYILIPPANFISEIGLLLRKHALDFYQDILSADLYKKNAKGETVLDINLARLKKTVLDGMQDRVYGTAVQNQNIVQNTTQKIARYDEKVKEMDAVEIQAELKKIEGVKDE